MLIDTAGRLHNQEPLMAELEKVRRVIARQLEGAPHETLLTIDATTGQNGLRQAEQFARAVAVDGIVLTKLDGSAKGGVAVAIARELGDPRQAHRRSARSSTTCARSIPRISRARSSASISTSFRAPVHPRRALIGGWAPGCFGRSSPLRSRSGELHTNSFYLAPFAVGGAIAAVLAALGAGGLVAVIAFAAAAILFLLLLRPVAVRHRRVRADASHRHRRADRPAGARVERIANREGVGTVKIGGEVWTARSLRRGPGDRRRASRSKSLRSGAPRRSSCHNEESHVVALIVVAVLVVVALAWRQRRSGSSPRPAPPCSSGSAATTARSSPGSTFITPFVDRVRPLIDLREQVVNFSPQPVITQDNVVVNIETVLYFTITDAKAATYEIASPLQAIEQLTVTTLRNVIGGLTLEQTLTSREGVNTELRAVLDEATGKWGIRINRVEIKSVDPPADIKAAMEKQMRAERDRRAAILTAEGTKQAAILTAEGEQQAAVLTAEGARQAAILRAEGEAKAIATVFAAIHAGNARPAAAELPVPADAARSSPRATANKVFVIPSEFTQAFAGIGDSLSRVLPKPKEEVT